MRQTTTHGLSKENQHPNIRAADTLGFHPTPSPPTQKTIPHEGQERAREKAATPEVLMYLSVMLILLYDTTGDDKIRMHQHLQKQASIGLSRQHTHTKPILLLLYCCEWVRGAPRSRNVSLIVAFPDSSMHATKVLLLFLSFSVDTTPRLNITHSRSRSSIPIS